MPRLKFFVPLFGIVFGAFVNKICCPNYLKTVGQNWDPKAYHTWLLYGYDRRPNNKNTLAVQWVEYSEAMLAI